ncbi:MAG TPA: P1 family peptidase [Pelolinea sp.]|nr:P1 family peptidase [Pelolinea sp.]
MTLRDSITDVENIKVGHAQNSDAMTGCTVILCGKGAVAGISQRGGAPGTRETDLLRPMHMVQKVHAIMLAGGSAFGLDAAGGAMRFLEEKKIGFNTGKAIVPIVPSAIIYDLGIGDPKVRPDAQMGYESCLNASSNKPEEGNYGAGTGATVGKIFGMQRAMKSGIGTSSKDIGGGIIIGAIAVVNAFGDVVNYRTREILAGARSSARSLKTTSQENFFADTLEVMGNLIGRGILSFASKQNTIIGVIATNASLDKERANKFAELAADGITLSVQPAFTMFDGDTVFSLSTGKKKVDINMLCAFAPFVFADAIIHAVKAASQAGDLPGSGF